MTGTNWYTCNYWGRKGAKRAVLAREMNVDAIVEIKENAEVEIEVQVHGMLNMFQSKRTLLGNYYQYQGKEMEIEKRAQEDKLFLHDKDAGRIKDCFWAPRAEARGSKPGDLSLKVRPVRGGLGRGGLHGFAGAIAGEEPGMSRRSRALVPRIVRDPGANARATRYRSDRALDCNRLPRVRPKRGGLRASRNLATSAAFES